MMPTRHISCMVFFVFSKREREVIVRFVLYWWNCWPSLNFS